MTTKISNIYDAIGAKAAEIFPDHIEHMNPYLPEVNDLHSLDLGYSFFLGPATNTEEMASCLLSVERTATFNITRRWYGTRNSLNERKEAEKLLLEDQLKLIDKLESDPTLEEEASFFKFSSDAGIEPIFGEGIQHVLIISTIQIRYTEKLGVSNA